MDTSDSLVSMFKAQLELLVKFDVIEREHGLLQTEDLPVNLLTVRGQARLRDFAWRIVEELSEAQRAETKEDRQEEVADAAHFLIELMLLTGLEPEDTGTTDVARWIDRPNLAPHPFHDEAWRFTTRLGRAMGELSWRPWNVLPRRAFVEKEFRRKMLLAWDGFGGVVRAAGMNGNDLLASYFKKNERNHERLRGS